MGYELLESVMDLLTAAGLRAGEEYPAGERVEIYSPVAAVGLRELDFAAGEARFTVRILSPRILGGWCCQTHGAKAAKALHEGGYAVQTGEMEYLSGSDCFCVTLTAVLPVIPGEGEWLAGRRWQVLCGEMEQENVISFRAVQDQGRRLIGATSQSEPVGVTPGSGGWSIELVQHITAEPEALEEPFELLVRSGGTEHRYGECFWNETEIAHTQGGLRLTRRGFALIREVRAVE